MAICSNCGATVSEDRIEDVCGVCGYPLEEKSTIEMNEVTESIDDEAEDVYKVEKQIVVEYIEKIKAMVATTLQKVQDINVKDLLERVKSGDKKIIALGATGILVVILVIATIAFSSASYMKPINNYMKAINKKSNDYLGIQHELLGKKLAKSMQKPMNFLIGNVDSYEDYVENLEDTLEDSFDCVEDEYDNFKLTFEKKSAEKIDSDDLEDIAEAITEYYEDMVDSYEDLLDDEDAIESGAEQMNINENEMEEYVESQIKCYESIAESRISSGYEVKGRFIIKAEDDEFRTNTVKLYILKINNDWVYVNSSESVSFKNDDNSLFSFILEFINNTPLEY